MATLPDKYHTERKYQVPRNHVKENMRKVIFDENLKAQRLKRERERSEDLIKNGHHAYNKNYGKLPEYV